MRLQVNVSVSGVQDLGRHLAGVWAALARRRRARRGGRGGRRRCAEAEAIVFCSTVAGVRAVIVPEVPYAVGVPFLVAVGRVKRVVMMTHSLEVVVGDLVGQVESFGSQAAIRDAANRVLALAG